MTRRWTYYSPTLRLVSAGELLRVVPSDRLWRLERVVDERGELLVEKVRAAEQLLGLYARAGLQNDAHATLTLQVREPTSADREQFAQIDQQLDQPLALVAELALTDDAHFALCDDVLVALETLFPGGVAVSETEVVRAESLREQLTREPPNVSHLDLLYGGDARHRAYTQAKLVELGVPGEAVVDTTEAIAVQARMPFALSASEQTTLCNAVMELAQHATAGHVRFRERGVWRDAVSNIGVYVVPLPQDAPRGMLARLSRLLRPR